MKKKMKKKHYEKDINGDQLIKYSSVFLTLHLSTDVLMTAREFSGGASDMLAPMVLIPELSDETIVDASIFCILF